MPDSDEASLVAVVARGADAAAAITRAWDAGAAVAPLDPLAPAAHLRARLDHLRPTHVDDGHGATARPGGAAVPAGLGAVVSTSGTTGEPRAVQLDRRALDASARAVHHAIGLEPGDRWLCCLPLHHVAGLAILVRARVHGLPVTVHDAFVPTALGAAVCGPACAGDRATLVSLVPTMLARLLDEGAPVARFRTVLLGGGPVPDELVARATEAGAHVATTYGMTETGGGCVHDGHPLPGVEVRLARDSDVDIGVAGEILVRGPVVMRGYHRDPEATARAFTADGRLRTGDLGAFDADGRLRVVDRLRDLVITGGVNVSPTAIEQALVMHPDIADVCVTGAADREWGERVVAFVVPVDGRQAPSLEALRAFARDHLSTAELPREIRVVADIPRTTGGKPRRAELRDRVR